jgi:hypothetical protein
VGVRFCACGWMFGVTVLLWFFFPLFPFFPYFILFFLGNVWDAGNRCQKMFITAYYTFPQALLPCVFLLVWGGGGPGSLGFFPVPLSFCMLTYCVVEMLPCSVLLLPSWRLVLGVCIRNEGFLRWCLLQVGCPGGFWVGLKRLQGVLNQAIIANEDVEGFSVMRRISFIIAAAVGRQLAARRH